jgi:hypothetical protein
MDFDPAVYQQYANLDAKHSLDQKHESWNLGWAFPNPRSIASNACISNSANIRLQHDASYKPCNLKQDAGVLAPTYSVVSVVAEAGA